MKMNVWTAALCVGNLFSLAAQDSLKVELPEIEITASKRLVKVMPDRTVYELRDDPEARASTLLDMLRKVPFVSVDGEENIRVNGSQNFQVYVDGKPSNLYTSNPKAVFRSLPASAIERIEVIADPGARYDAEGVSGILNLITRKQLFEGYSGNLMASGSNRYAQAGGFGMMAYGRFSLSGNYTYSYSKNKIETNYAQWQKGDRPGSLTSFQSGRFQTPYHQGGLEASFELDSLHLLSASASFNFYRPQTEGTGTYQKEDAFASPLYRYSEQTENQNQAGGASAKIDYQQVSSRRKGEMFTLSYQYSYLRNKQTLFRHKSSFEGDTLALGELYRVPSLFQDDQGNTHEHTAQLDYYFPFTPIHALEAGAKHIFRRNASDTQSLYRPEEASTWLPFPDQPDVSYRHRQHITSLYGAYHLRAGTWGADAGIRLEHTAQRVEQEDEPDYTYRHLDWVPSLSLFYQPHEAHSLKLGYNQRIRRPDITYLNPARILSSTSVSYGNPALVSEKHHRLALNYNYVSPQFTLQAMATYLKGRHIIDAYSFVDEEGMVNKTYGNKVHSKGGVLQVYLNYNPSPKTHLSLNGQAGYVRLEVSKGDPHYPEGWSHAGGCGNVFFNGSQRFPYGWQLVATGGMMVSEPSLGTSYRPYYYYGCMLQKSFWNEKLTLALRLQDFAQRATHSRYETHYPDYSEKVDSLLFGRSVALTLSYRFGNLKEGVKKATRSIQNEDVKRKP